MFQKILSKYIRKTKKDSEKFTERFLKSVLKLFNLRNATEFAKKFWYL